MPGRRVAGAAFLLSVWFVSALNAQEPEESAREAVEQRVFDEQRRDADRDRAAAMIPFEQVLSAPQDIQLNLAYARQQIAGGDLKEAGSTLERILLVDPALHDIRVLYGLVLYRLGLFDRARYELELAVDSGRLPMALRAEAEAYLNRIKYQQRPTRGSLTLTTGVDWDRNRNQAPSGGRILGLGIEGVLSPESRRNGDAAFVLSARGTLVHDLGSQEGHSLHADVTYYHSDKHEVDRLDLDAVSLAAGGTFYVGAFSITPRLRSGFYWLEGQDYLATYGGEIELAYRWSPRVRSYVTVRGDDEDFRNTQNFGVAALRSGRRLSSRVGTEWRISMTQRVSIEGVFMDKNASRGFEAYERYGVNAQHSLLLGRGAFSLIGVWAENSHYDAADPLITPFIVRDEWLYRARATIGAPISLFLPNAPEGVKDINIIAQYEYETVDSNIFNFDYDTHKAAFLLSKRIAF